MMDSWDPKSPEWTERLAFVRRVLSNSRYELTREDREELAQDRRSQASGLRTRWMLPLRHSGASRSW